MLQWAVINMLNQMKKKKEKSVQQRIRKHKNQMETLEFKMQ